MMRVVAGWIVVSLAAAILVSGCEWDYPIWSKNPRSDTALFQFRIGTPKQAAGYIDRAGRIVIPAMFSVSSHQNDDDFFDGVALVDEFTNPKYIDVKGKVLFSGHRSGSFSEGLASFEESGRSGYLDTKGLVAIPATFQSADDFSENLAVVQNDALKSGYIDRAGHYVIAPRFARGFPFRNGIARVIEQGHCVYIGYAPCDSFNPVMPPFTMASPRFPVANLPRCRYSFIDKTGRALSSETYLEAKDFSEGLAPVGDGIHWGFVNTKGELVIPMVYRSAMPFSDGLAVVSNGKRYGYIDHEGKLAIPLKFAGAYPFSEGLAAVADDYDRCTFIGRTGQQAFPDFFSDVSSFVMGLAHVRIGRDYERSTWAWINRNGRAVFRYDIHGPLPLR